jgi:hypothetical protein
MTASVISPPLKQASLDRVSCFPRSSRFTGISAAMFDKDAMKKLSLSVMAL